MDLEKTNNNSMIIKYQNTDIVLEDKCFVLIDLKTNKVTHQDIGQMDMYVRMYDELKKAKDDNPTIGILLCTDTDADVARYSVLHGNEQLFATKYKTYLPTEEQLKAEIESQKAIFEIQQQEKRKVMRNEKRIFQSMIGKFFFR